ncbi:hypothetical protein [Azonexus hydrophilus]|uniref:hypothetical protein n=1 Tax=Azonexus hydrophilus TaxID=418702 RepID=UPI0012F88F50|nr:hypothetical protein [Azonexus hydrophilus]
MGAALPNVIEIVEEPETEAMKPNERREMLRLRQEAEREKRRLELKARENEKQAKNIMQRWHPELKKGTNVQKIDVIINRFVGQLIEENRGKGLLEVEYTNKEMVQRRKDQMSVIKEHINLIKQLKDVRGMLADGDEESDKQNLQSAENIELIDEAKELLAQRGVKLDI